MKAEIDRVDDDVNGLSEAALKAKLAETEKERDTLRDSQKHWVRYVVTAVVAFLTGGILLALGRMLK